MVETYEYIVPSIAQFLTSVGKIDSYTAFAPAVLRHLGELVSFDQAVAVYMDANGIVVDCHLVGVSQTWSNAYRKYYAQLQEQFPLGWEGSRRNVKELQPAETLTWAKLPPNDFIVDCINPRGITHSIHLFFFDTRHRIRTVLALDRVRPENFSRADLAVLDAVSPYIDDLHRKFFLSSMPYERRIRRRDALMETAGLTRREKEIVICLCDGMPPAEISQHMSISVTTTHKHIANIYKKMGVTTLQGLLVRLLNERSTPDRA